MAANVASWVSPEGLNCPMVRPIADVESVKNVTGTCGYAAMTHRSAHTNAANSELVLEAFAAPQIMPEFSIVALKAPMT